MLTKYWAVSFTLHCNEFYLSVVYLDTTVGGVDGCCFDEELRRQTCWCLSTLSTPCWRHGDDTGDRTAPCSTPATQLSSPPGLTSNSEDWGVIKLQGRNTVNIWPGVLLTQTGASSCNSSSNYPQITSWQVFLVFKHQMKWVLTVDIEVCYGGILPRHYKSQESVIMLSDSHWKLSPSLLRQFSWSTCKHGYYFESLSKLL